MKTPFKFKSPQTADHCIHYYSSSQPLRIADILQSSSSDQEEDEDENDGVLGEILMEGSSVVRMSIDCASSPRRIVGRWLSGMRRGKVKKGKQSKRELCGDGTVEVRRSIDESYDKASVNLGMEAALSGQCMIERSVNLGVGCCLLYLLAASKNELDKIMEMRMQMEALIKNGREELNKQRATPKPSDELNDIFAYSTMDAPESLDFDNQNHLSPQIITTPEYAMPESAASGITVCDQSLKFETPKQEECFEGMNPLEAELEAELERLQLHLDMEKLPKHSRLQQRRLLETTKWLQVFGADNASSKNPSVSSVDVIDPMIEPQAAVTEVSHGVPPHELERRLHELLEARQREQIKELEAALECAKRKLRDKELEVSWWKDTAQLISRQAPEASRFTSQLGPKLLSP